MRRYPPALLAAIVAFGVAAFLFGAAFVGALSVTPIPQAAPASSDTTTEAAPPTQARALTTDALILAVDSDPFRPERQRWPDRYRLPGEDEPHEPPPPPPPPPAPPFRLIGTAVTPRGALAVIEVEGNTRVLDVGESLLGYTLTEVSSERAVMEGTARTVQLPLVAAAGPPPTRGGRPGQAPAPPGRAPADAAREMIERIRSSGGNVTPQMLEMIQRLQQEGRTVEIQTQPAGPGQPARTMIRTRPDTTDAAPRAPFQR